MSLGLRRGQGKRIEAFGKDWLSVITAEFSTLWIRLCLASLKVLKSSDQYRGRESQLHLNRNCLFSSCRYGPEGDWNMMLRTAPYETEGDRNPPHFLCRWLNVFLLCAASSTAEVWFMTALPVQLSTISDVDTFHLDFYGDLLSHCPLERVQLNF